MRFEQQIRSACSVNGAVVHPQICPHVEAVSSRRGGCVFRALPRRDLAGINNMLRIKALFFSSHAHRATFSFTRLGICHARSAALDWGGNIGKSDSDSRVSEQHRSALGGGVSPSPPRAHLDRQMGGLQEANATGS